MAIRERIKTQKKVLLDLLSKLHEPNREKVLITKYLDPQFVLFTDSKSRDDIIKELVQLLEKKGVVDEGQKFYEAVIQREKIVSTGIGLGIAIPHAKLESFQDFFLAMGVLKEEGVEWNSLDKAPVRLVFLIGGPSNKQTQYLTILSKITAAMKNEQLRCKLFEATSPEQFVEILQDHFSIA